MKDAVLGAVVTALIAVIAYLFFTKEDTNAGAYNPYNVAGTVPATAAPGQPAPAQPATAPAPKPVVVKQVVKQGEPKKPKKPAGPSPDPKVLAAQNLQQLMQLINSFGNPSGPDQERGCYIEVTQWIGTTPTKLATVDEKCTMTPYPGGDMVLRRNDASAFFKLFGSPVSLIRIDPAWPDINLFEPRAPGFVFDYNWGSLAGTLPNCYSSDDGVNIEILVCTPNP